MITLNKSYLIYICFSLILFTNCEKPEIIPVEPPVIIVGVASVTTLPASGISKDSAVVGGFIVLNGDVPVLESGICFDSIPNPSITSNKVIKTVASDTLIILLKDLKPATNYYYKAYLRNVKGIKYGNELSFKTAADSVGFIKRIEESYYHGITPNTSKNRDYSFYYDSTNRLISVGLRSHSPVGFDTATCSLYYKGANTKPYMIITPNTQSINPVLYDTVYFSYNSANQIIKDSTNESGYLSATQRVARKRVYQYPDAITTIVHWYAPLFLNGPQEIVRADTIKKQAVNVKTNFYGFGGAVGNYAKTEGFTYSNFINPLAKLNISGTIYSLIYKPTNFELFGNSAHKAVYNSNVLAYYLDFYSEMIPKSFFIGGYSPGGFLISAQSDLFTINITPSPRQGNYPAQIEVHGRTSLPDAKFIYKFYY